MSIEQPYDPVLVEQTKQQLRALVAEIAQLAKSEVSPEEFYSQFLPRVVSALAAVGGAIWALNPQGQLSLQYQINLQEARLRDSETAQAQHTRLLYKVLTDEKALVVPPHSGPGGESLTDEKVPANPTDFLLLLGVLKTDLETVGIVEILQRSDVSVGTQKGYLRFLNQMCDLACEFLKGHQLRHFSHRQTLWSRLEDFARAVHASLDPQKTAYTIANEGRRLIECDRVSVAIRRGKHCRVAAISGQDLFDKRSNTVRLLGRLAAAVVNGGEAVWYSGDTRHLAPQVEEALQEYVDEAHTKALAVLPLGRPSQSDTEEEKQEDSLPLVGALIVEQIEDSRLTPQLKERTEVVCRHSSLALANAMEYHGLFLMPLWRTLGKARWVVQARTLPKTLSVAGGVLALLLILCLWPARFTVEAKGTLEPVQRQDVFAGIDGVVEELFVAHGQQVTKGQLLVRLRNTDLEVAITDIQGQRLATGERLFAVQRALVEERKLSIEERSRLAGEQAELKQRLQALDAQWALYKAKQLELEVKSPIDGIVVTWDLRNRLIHRPVQRGQVLLRVADPAGPWQLELHLPENRIGHVVKAQAAIEPSLPVSYILATEPGVTREGTVAEVYRSAEVRGDEGNTVLIKVVIDKTELPFLRPGATVTARIYCGRRPLGYVWLHDLIAFVQSRILFRYF